MPTYFELQNGPVLTTPSALTSPKITSIGYPGDDTAADTAGGQTITLTGAGFETGATVLINTTAVGVVTVVNSTTITFISPANSAGSYVLYVINTDGGTAIAVPGIQYSGVPTWTTAAGSLGSYTETVAIANTVTATGDAPITYSVFSGSLPTGATLNSANGYISGTSPLAASPTTYTFTIRATDGQQQDTNRSFSLTINPDVVTWSSPANGTTYTSFANSAISNVALSASAASGQGIVYTANALPTGLSISGSNITGTPTAVANSSTLLTATANTTNATATRTINWVISVANDTYFPYVTSLLSASTPASTFVTDASTNSFNVTVNGDTRPSNFGPYTPGYYSAYFDGTGDYLTVPNNAALSFGTADFTVECWAYFTSLSSNLILFDRWTSGDLSGWQLYYRATGTSIAWYDNGTVQLQDPSASRIVANQWYHIAVARTGTTLNMFINGVLVATTTNSTSLTNTNTLGIGAQVTTGTNYFTGYISNARIVKGTAVYTAAFTPSTTPLTAIANTSLLTCQSNRFIDNSTNNFTITRNGDTLISSFDPFVPSSSFAGYGSGYFDGNGDSLSYTGGSSLNFGTGDFTIETWAYLTNTGTFSAFLRPDDTGAFPEWGYDFSSGQLKFDARSGAIVATTTTMPTNQWVHLAVSRSGTSLRQFINGTQVGSTTTNSTNFGSTTGLIRIGGSSFSASHSVNGYLSNFRVVVGTAVYTSTFTPSTTPLTAIANTSLLTLQNNQPNNNSMFLDSSASNFLITRNGNTTQGSFSPYGGGWSNYFDGTGDSLQAPSGSSISGTGNFTVEFWIYPLSFASGYQVIYANDTSSGFSVIINSSGTLGYGRSLVATDGTTTGSVTFNQWNHVAWVRSGTGANQFRCYINGTLAGTFTNSTNYASGIVRIGTDGGGSAFPYIGYISNLRNNSTAIYASAFTPSTTPLTPIAGTSLLTCADNRFIDDSGNNFTVTRNGDVSVQRFNPFNPVLTTPTSYSGYFDGTGDYLSVPANTAFVMGTGDFTAEAWIYPTATPVSANGGIISNGGDSNQSANQTFIISLTTTNTISIYLGTSVSGTSITTSTTVSLNTWNHIAVTRSGNNFTIWLNGVSAATGTNSVNLSASTTVLIGRQYTDINGRYFTGYISNLRVVKGTAVYTSNFTPSTTPLTAIANTSLLTLQSPTFIDNSTNNFTITNNGDTAPRQFNPFGWTSTTGSSAAYTPALYGGSAYFDGSGDGLVISSPPASLRSWATGDFTVEAWVYPTSFNGWSYNDGQTHSTLVGNRSTTNSGDYWSFGPCTDGVVRFYYYNGSSPITVSSGLSIALNQWSHVAFTKTSSGMRFYVNGIASGFTAISGTPVTGSELAFTVGVANNTVLTGYVSDLRIVNGTAVYKASFAPPVAPFTALQNTTLLNSMTGAGIYDSSMMNNYETVGNASINTALKKYGNTSMYFDGTGDYVFAPSNATTSLTGNFTIELWAYRAASGNYRAFTIGDTVGTSGIEIYVSGTPTGNWVVYSNSATRITGASATRETWTHLALVRSGSTVTLYVNGIASGSTWSSSATFSGAVYVGAEFFNSGVTSDTNGYIDDFRITNGIARYTTTFTPPTTPFITN